MGEQQTKEEFFECMYNITYYGLREFVKKVNSIYTRHLKFEISWEKWEEQIEDKACELSEIEEYKDILSEKEYELLIKKYREGYTHKELAQMTHNSVAGSKMRLSRILKKIRKNL